MNKVIHWWIDNFKRPSTWSGVACLFIAIYLLEHSELLNQFLSNIVNNTKSIDLVIGAISGGLIAHKQRKECEKIDCPCKNDN